MHKQEEIVCREDDGMLLVKAVESFKKYMWNRDMAMETVKSYTIELKQFAGFIAVKYNGPVYMEEIRLQDLEEYLQMLKERNYSPASRNHSLYVLRSFFNFCMKKEYVPGNIGARLERLPSPKKERIYLTADEVEQLLSAIDSPIAVLILKTLFYTGMRISECINLETSDVDQKNNTITVRNTKGKKDRQIPIHMDLQRLLAGYLESWRKRKTSRYLFTTRNTDRVSPDYMNRILRDAVQSLGWTKKVTCHTIRHSFASNLAAKNVNIVNIQKLLGHSNLATTSIYTHTNMIELTKAISRI